MVRPEAAPSAGERQGQGGSVETSALKANLPPATPVQQAETTAIPRSSLARFEARTLASRADDWSDEGCRARSPHHDMGRVRGWTWARLRSRRGALSYPPARGASRDAALSYPPPTYESRPPPPPASPPRMFPGRAVRDSSTRCTCRLSPSAACSVQRTTRSSKQREAAGSTHPAVEAVELAGRVVGVPGVLLKRCWSACRGAQHDSAANAARSAPPSRRKLRATGSPEASASVRLQLRVL